MTIKEVIKILDAQVYCGEEDDMDIEIQTACGSDMMSDALAYVKEKGMLLTGLLNQQSVRTADMLDMHCIVFVRGKIPGDDIIALAKSRGIVVLSTSHRMFTACGELYINGLSGGSK